LRPKLDTYNNNILSASSTSRTHKWVVQQLKQSSVTKDGGGGVGLGEDKSSAPHKRRLSCFLSWIQPGHHNRNCTSCTNYQGTDSLGHGTQPNWSKLQAYGHWKPHTMVSS
jgi:hypothetical protein